VIYKVHLQPLAESDLDEIYDFIAADNPERAFSFVRELREQCEGLRRMPQRGAPREDWAKGLRVLVVKRRVTIAYLIEPDTVQILRLLYAGRDFRSPGDDGV